MAKWFGIESWSIIPQKKHCICKFPNLAIVNRVLPDRHLGLDYEVLIGIKIPKWSIPVPKDWPFRDVSRIQDFDPDRDTKQKLLNFFLFFIIKQHEIVYGFDYHRHEVVHPPAAIVHR